MAYIELISKSDIAAHINISVSNTDDKLKPFIREAQEIDLKEALCRDFYFDVLKNKALDDYAKLLDGETYTEDSIEYNYLGLKKVISHYAYARYVEGGHQVDTGLDIVQKRTEWSEPVSHSDKRKLAIYHRNIANNYMKEVRLYLDYITTSDSSKFTVYQSCCSGSSNNKNSINHLKSDLV